MPESRTAAEWLLAEFDAASFEEIFAQPEHSADDEWPVHPQPMITFKSLTYPCAGMHVTASDYSDPQRWRL